MRDLLVFFNDLIVNYSHADLLTWIICVLAVSFVIVFLLYRIKILKEFDRTFSTKTSGQIIWLIIIVSGVFCILVTLLFVLHFDLEMQRMKCLDDNYGTENWKKLIFALMLDPGQIDHIKDDSDFHLYSILCALLGLLVVTGLTISTFTNIVQRRVNNYLNGEVRYKNIKDQYVIIGFGELAVTIIEQLLHGKDGKNRKVLLMSKEDTKEVRRTINTVIEKKYERCVTIYSGRKDNYEDVKNLNIAEAREVFLIGEKEEVNRDASNVEALQKIIMSIKEAKPNWDINSAKISKLRNLLNEKLKIKNSSVNFSLFELLYDKIVLNNLVVKFLSKRIRCLRKQNRRIPVMILFEYQTTYAAFQITDIADDWKKYIEFRPFNYYENWAKKLFYTKKYSEIDGSGLGYEKKKYINYPSLDRIPITKESEQGVHLVIFSMSRMGVALGTFAAQICHFPNFMTKGIKTRITFITPEADTEINFFRGRYSRFFDVTPAIYRDFEKAGGKEIVIEPQQKDYANMIDVEFEFIKGKAEMPQIRNLLCKWANDERQILTIAICLRDPSKNMAIGLYLPDLIYKKQIPIFIRQKSSGALLSQLKQRSEENEYQKYKEIYPFGMQENCFDLDDVDRLKAQLLNYYYSLRVITNKVKKNELLNELNEKWAELDIALQWSNLYHVFSLPFKLNSINNSGDYKVLSCTVDENGNIKCASEETLLLAEVEHNRWNVEKLLLGYRVYNTKERAEDNYYVSKAKEDEKNIKELKLIRKNHEHIDFAHNAIMKYSELGMDNKSYDIIMTGNIPQILEIINGLTNESIDNEQIIYYPSK